MQGQGKMGGGERTLMVGGLFLSLCMNEPIKHILYLVVTPFLVFRITVFVLDKYSVAQTVPSACSP